MRILFIENENLQNDAIIEIVTSEDGYEVDRIIPVKVEEQAVEPNPHNYQIALVDLDSFPYSPDASIQLIKSNNIAHHIIAIHNYTENQLIQSIMEAGADFYFSVDSNADSLIEKMRELTGS